MGTKLFFNKRILLWTAAILVFGLSMKILLPDQVQKKLCEVYRLHWSATVLKALQYAMIEPSTLKHAPESQPAHSEGRASVLSLGTGITPELLEQYIQSYICIAQPQPIDSLPHRILVLLPTVLPAAYVLAVLICFFLPPKPKVARRGGAVYPLHTVPSAPPKPSPASSDRERIENYPDLALRAAQTRTTIVYAFLSGVSTTLLRPDFFQSNSFFSANGAHILGLAACAFGAAVWATHTPALRYPDMKAFRIAIRIGFGGVFFGSLIALSIALPYQMLTPVPNAAMSEHQALIIILIRLLILPTSGLIGASLCVLVARKLGGRSVTNPGEH